MDLIRNLRELKVLVFEAKLDPNEYLGLYNRLTTL